MIEFIIMQDITKPPTTEPTGIVPTEEYDRKSWNIQQDS